MEHVIKFQNNEEEAISINNSNNNFKIDNECKEIIVNNLENESSKKPKIFFKNNFTLELIKSSIQTKFEKELYKSTKSELFFFIFLSGIFQDISVT